MRARVTDRQLQCLSYSLMYGNGAAAKMLGISEQTVKNNLSVLYRRLGVNGKGQAAYELGWIDIPDDLKVRTVQPNTRRYADGRKKR